MNDLERLEKQNKRIKDLQRVSRLAGPHKMKAMRVKADLSLRVVEKDTGLSRGVISKIEKGETKNPSWNTLFKLILFYEQEEQYRLDTIYTSHRLEQRLKDQKNSSRF